MNGCRVENSVASPAGPPSLLEWKFSQVFGERSAGEEVQEGGSRQDRIVLLIFAMQIALAVFTCYLALYLFAVDVISAIEFDKTGDHLATGDRGGRVVLFERTDSRGHGHRRDLERLHYSIGRHPEFRYRTEFQSHEPEVQEKKVKKISEMNVDPSRVLGHCIIPSSNNKANVHLPNGECSQKPKSCLSEDFKFPPAGIPSLRLPVIWFKRTEGVFDWKNSDLRRKSKEEKKQLLQMKKLHQSDGETFISADDLRINLWNLEISNQSFNIVDVKPANMEDLTEVITSAVFHPDHCHMLAYSSSKGSIRLIDLRQSALCDNHSKLLEEHEAPGSSNLFRVFGCAPGSNEATTLEATKNPMRFETNPDPFKAGKISEHFNTCCKTRFFPGVVTLNAPQNRLVHGKVGVAPLEALEAMKNLNPIYP
ncbi:hypothetical protein ACLOJK_019914 [Asimina triloba]